MTMSLETRPLHVPPLEELAKVLEEGLKGTFAEVSVGVVECPDLSLPPWNLATPGLCGSPRLLDVGGVPYLMPVADKNKHYDLGEVAAMAGVPGGLIIGAGAGSSRVAGVNCEMMPNARAPHGADPGLNNTYIAKVSTEVYVLDARNHGESPHVPETTYGLMSEDTVHFMKQEGLTRTILIGHSMGGRTAMLTALRHPELVERLVVLDVTPVGRPERGGQVGELLRHMRELDISSIQSRRQADQLLRDKITTDTTRDFLLTNLVVDQATGGLRWKVNLEAVDKALHQLVTFPEMGGATYGGPTLFLGGEQSEMISSDTIPEIKKLFPRATVEHIPRTGHLLHVERPDAVVAAINNFLSSQ